MMQAELSIPLDTAEVVSRRQMVFFVAVQLFVFSMLIRDQGTWLWLLWYCNHVALLYAVVFYTRKTSMIQGVMQVGILTQLIWVLDFMGHLAGINLFHAADYIFDGPLELIEIAAIIAHTVVPFTVFMWIYKIRPSVTSLIYSGIYIALLYAVTLVARHPEENINCVYTPCSPLTPDWYYTSLWPLYLFLLAFLTFILQRFLYDLFWTRHQIPHA